MLWKFLPFIPSQDIHLLTLKYHGDSVAIFPYRDRKQSGASEPNQIGLNEK